MLKRTPLYHVHRQLGARMAPFAGWEMPIQYRSVREEVRAVRCAAGLFDISHMGRIRITGEEAASFLDRLLTVNVQAMKESRARYALLCNPQGGILDDLVLYRCSKEDFLLVCNAATREGTWEWLKRHARGYPHIALQDQTGATAMLALQGPQALALIQDSGIPLSSLKPFTCSFALLYGTEVFLARTGYTGEEGLELVFTASEADSLWDLFMSKGASPCGLGSRDVLRLEAGLRLYGQDMDATVTPLEAGLDPFVDFNKEEFVGREALLQIRERGVRRRLVGFCMREQGVPRKGYPIRDGPRHIGQVTSGCYSPTLDRYIGLGYVAREYTTPGSLITLVVRERCLKAEVVSLPFYSRRRNDDSRRPQIQ